MATFGLLALTLGPCLAFCGWVFKIGTGKPSEKRQGLSSGRLSARDIPKNKRAQAVKDWLAHEKRMQQHAKENPDHFQ
jgi:hypothetical protein